MLKQAEKFKEEDKKRRELVDLKNEAHNVYETTKRQLEEFRSKIPADVIEGIEKALNQLNELKDKDLQPADIESVKKAIDDARNAAMKIGQSMHQSNPGSSGQEEKKEEEKKEDEEKKN